MPYPTKADIKRQNADCFARILDEYKRIEPLLEDVYYSECDADWVVQIRGERPVFCATFRESTNFIMQTIRKRRINEYPK